MFPQAAIQVDGGGIYFIVGHAQDDARARRFFILFRPLPHGRNFFLGGRGDFFQAGEFGVEFGARLEQRNAVIKIALNFGGSVNFFSETSDVRGNVINLVKFLEIFSELFL